MKVLECQIDSYATRAQVEIQSCLETPGGYSVQLDRSIAFPGGGGQPADFGRLNELKIERLHLDGEERIWADLQCPLPLGPCEMTIDWPRRFDHMQQHTAQHLLTAVAEKEFGWSTLAFHLNPDRSDIVLDTPPPSWEALNALEDAVNALIRDGRPVRLKSMSLDEVAAGKARYRRLPENVKLLRMVEIDGVDLNPCGGTHVRSTSELQLIRLIAANSEKGGHTRLHFLAGDRAIRAHRECVRRDGVLTQLLSEPAEAHHSAVRRIQGQLIEARKNQKQLEMKLGEHWVLGLDRRRLIAGIHLKSGTATFCQAVSKWSEDLVPHMYILITTGSSGTGTFLLLGPEKSIDQALMAVNSVLQGRGGGRGRRRQGKTEHPEKIDEALGAVVRTLGASGGDSD